MAQLTAQEAMQLQRESNQKQIERADESYLDLGTVKIFNVGPMPYVIGLGGLGLYTVPACPQGRIYSRPLEVWKMTPEGYNVDMNKMAERLVNGWAIAEAIVGYGQQMHESTDMRKMGIFTCGGYVTVESEDGTRGKILASLEKPYMKVNRTSKVINIRQATKPAIDAARKCGYTDLLGQPHGGSQPEKEIIQDIIDGHLPTEADLDEATGHLHKYCTNLVHEANDYYRNNDLKEIQPLHRWSGQFTNQIDLPWMKTSLIMGKCGVCGNQLNPDVAICLACKSVVPGKEHVVIANCVQGYERLWDPSHPAYKAPAAAPKGKQQTT